MLIMDQHQHTTPQFTARPPPPSHHHSCLLLGSALTPSQYIVCSFRESQKIVLKAVAYAITLANFYLGLIRFRSSLLYFGWSYFWLPLGSRYNMTALLALVYRALML